MFSYLHPSETMLSLTYSFNRSYTAFLPKQVWLLFADSCPQIRWVVAFYLTCQVHIGVQKEQLPSPIIASSKMDDSVVITLGCESAQHPLLLIHYYSVMAALSVRQNTLFVFPQLQRLWRKGRSPVRQEFVFPGGCKGGGGLCHWHISNDIPGIKGEYNLIKCLLTDSLANREAA